MHDELPSDERIDRLSCRSSMRPASLTLVLVLAGCAGSADPVDVKTPTSSTEPQGTTPSPDSKPTASPSASAAPDGPMGPGACRLPAPVVSDDSCTKDADCAPSVPCHARACVAVSKAVPRTPDTMCTMNIDCASADVNPCSCYEGRCALVPKSN